MSAVAAASYRRTVKYDTEALDVMIHRAQTLMIDRVSRGQVQSTLELLLRLKNAGGSYTECYMHSKNSCGGFGRYYPQGGGMAYIHRPVRGSLARNFYHDLDMINSLPVITVQFAKNKYNFDLKNMQDYIARRPHYYAMLVRDFGLKPIAKKDFTTESVEDQAKRMVNAVINGSALPKATAPIKPAMKFLQDLKAEMKRFVDVLKDDATYAELWAWTKENKKTPASFCSKIVQREEANVLIAIDVFLTTNGRVTASWIYDGLFVEKFEGETTLPSDLIARCIAYVKEVCGYDIGLKVKPFEPYAELDTWLAEWRTASAIERMHTSVLVSGTNTILPERRVSHRFVGQCLEAIGDISEYTTLIINSHLGTGKTTEAVKMMKQMNPDGSLRYPRILIISARKSFTRFIIGDLEREGLGFVAYDAPRPFFTPLSSEDRVVVQLESLWKLEESFADYDFVVIDESETVLNQFYSLNTHKENIRKNHEIFERTVRNAKFVLYADAFVNQERTLLNATYLREKSRIMYINNTFCPYERKATELYATKEVDGEDGEKIQKETVAFKGFCNAILEDLKAGKKLVVIWTSLRKAQAFANTYLKDIVDSSAPVAEAVKPCPYKWRLYSSKSNAAENKELENVAESWKDLNLLMMTTSITVGINYNPTDDTKIYDKIYLYACAKSALPRDIAQCLMRCRRIRSNELVYTIDRLVTSWNPSSRAAIRAAFLHRRENNRTANPLINWTDSSEWVMENYITNERECFSKSHTYVADLEGFLLRSGYTIERKEIENTDAKMEGAKFDPAIVPIINYYEAEEIRKKVHSGLADELERQSLRRYNIGRNLAAAPEEGDDIEEDIWVKCYKSMEYERVFWNLVGEKHTSTAKFAERESHGKFTEMVSKKVAKRIILDKVMGMLDMKTSAEGKSDIKITTEIVEAMKPLEAEVYRAFSERGKSRRKGDLTASHIVDMLDMIFGDWIGKSKDLVVTSDEAPAADDAKAKKSAYICLDVDSKKQRVPKSETKITVFTVSIPARPMWDSISDTHSVATATVTAEEDEDDPAFEKAPENVIIHC